MMDQHLISYLTGLLVVAIAYMIVLIFKKKSQSKEPLSSQIKESFDAEMQVLRNKVFSIQEDICKYEELDKMPQVNIELSRDNENMRHNIEFMRQKKGLFEKNPLLMQNYRVTNQNSLFDYMMSNTRNK